ncbi:uncharacterized protein [Misgurnus anguillicaudatus]|uniref:uncharacterized protein n=1 Tax=Misgurnus anguillicaudatus TaxID=75329 RepID=UPI003CCF40F8
MYVCACVCEVIFLTRGLEESDTALRPCWTLELCNDKVDKTKCLLGTEGDTTDVMFALVPGDVTPDHILVTHHLHYGRVSGPDSLDEELEVLAVIGQHCPNQRRLEGAIIRVGLGPQTRIKVMEPVENIQPHHHPVIHLRLEERLHGRQTLCLAASPVDVKDLGYRLIGEPKPLHHATAHGPQLFHRLLTGRCRTWTVSGSGSPEHFPPQPGERRAAGAAHRVALWEEVPPGTARGPTQRRCLRVSPRP